MIFTLATAALLSCGEAQSILNRIDSTQMTRREYSGVVEEVRRMAPRRCRLAATPTLFKGDIRRIQRERRHIPRPIYIRPTIVWSF